MAARQVIRMGHPTLRLVATPVNINEINTPEFKALLADMYDTMKVEGGIGIAAPQIDVSKQVAMIELPANNERYGTLEASKLYIIINPEISIIDFETQGFWEGCLSVPGIRGFVERPKSVQIDYVDEYGEARQIIADQFLATVFQHEIDHLNGKIFIDRVTDTTKLSYQDEFLIYNCEKAEDNVNE